MSSPIPKAALAQHVIVLGKTGVGKSSAMRLLVEGLLDDAKPLTIIDPKGDWWGIKSAADGKRPGYPVVIFGGEHADVPINAHAGAAVAELVATGNRPSLIDLGGWMVGERTRFFIEFASSLFKQTRGARYLVIDEVHNFAPQGKIMDVDAGKMLHWANRLASEGRGKGLTLLAASQRPQKVHKDFLTCAETLIAMKVIHKLDRDAIKDWIDGCADPAIGKEVLTTLAGMKRGEAWAWSPEIEFGPERVKFPMFSTYDSFKPQAADAGKLKGWAEVDLEEVRKKLAASIEQAQANDPATLKRRIAELERQVRTAAPAPAGATKEELQAAEQRGFANGHRRGWDECGAAHTAASASVVYDAPAGPMPKAAYTVHPQRTRAPATNQALRQVAKAAAAHVNGNLTAPRQKILDQLAWLESLGLYPAPKETLAAVCGVSPTSGGYFNNLGALRSAGLIEYPQGGVVAFTTEGRATANAPRTDGRPIHEHWLDIVTGPQRLILEALLELHPDAISKDALAKQIGVPPTSGGFFNNLGRLRTLGAIDYPSPGHAALTRYVMP